MIVRKVRVHLHQEAEGCWADSPDAPGFTAVAPDLDELRERATKGIQFMFEDEKIPLLLLFAVVGTQEAPVAWLDADILEIGAHTSAGSLRHADFVTEPMPDTDVKDVEVEAEVRFVET